MKWAGAWMVKAILAENMLTVGIKMGSSPILDLESWRGSQNTKVWVCNVGSSVLPLYEKPKNKKEGMI